jgi:hypothetical protein
MGQVSKVWSLVDRFDIQICSCYCSFVLILFVFLGSHGMPILIRSFICFSIVSLNSNVDQYETFVFFRLSVLQCVHVSKDMQGYDRLRVMSRAPVNAKVSGHFFVSDVVHCGFLFVLFYSFIFSNFFFLLSIYPFYPFYHMATHSPIIFNGWTKNVNLITRRNLQ